MLAIGSPRTDSDNETLSEAWGIPGTWHQVPGTGSPRLDQLFEGFAMVEQVLGPARRVDELRRLGIDAEVLVGRGVHAVQVHRRLGLARQAVGRADHLPVLQAAARDPRRGDARPMVAARLVVHPRRPAELAPEH